MINFSHLDVKELASLIYETLENSGIKAILVGGACVSIYTHNRYQSIDLPHFFIGTIYKLLNKLSWWPKIMQSIYKI